MQALRIQFDPHISIDVLIIYLFLGGGGGDVIPLPLLMSDLSYKLIYGSLDLVHTMQGRRKHFQIEGAPKVQTANRK